MGVNDVFLQVMHRLYGIVARNHHEVRGIEIDCYARGAERIEEFPQHCRGLGSRFDGEMRTETVGIGGKLIARLLHDLVALMVLILGNDADVRSNDVCFHLQSKIYYPFGAFHVNFVVLHAHKAVTEVTADRGKLDAVVLCKLQQLAALFGAEVFGCELSARSVHLNTVQAQTARLFDRLVDLLTEGFHNDTYWKLIHNYILLASIARVRCIKTIIA